MTRYAIIILAIAVGAAIGLFLARRRRKNRAADATLVEARPFWQGMLPWVGGLAVLLAGLLILADHERAPRDSEYRPATTNEGDITPGGFGDYDQ